jgi:hypothetical protein
MTEEMHSYLIKIYFCFLRLTSYGTSALIFPTRLLDYYITYNPFYNPWRKHRSVPRPSAPCATYLALQGRDLEREVFGGSDSELSTDDEEGRLVLHPPPVRS